MDITEIIPGASDIMLKEKQYILHVTVSITDLLGQAVSATN